MEPKLIGIKCNACQRELDTTLEFIWHTEQYTRGKKGCPSEPMAAEMLANRVWIQGYPTVFLVREEVIDLLEATDSKSKKQEEWLDPTAIPFSNGTQSKQRHILIVTELRYELSLIHI